MVFVADDLAAWLVGLLADAGRKKLTSLVLGTEQERALRAAATTAVQLTAAELRSGDAGQGEDVVLVISHVFGELVTAARLAGQTTVLEALQAGITSQLAVLDDPGLTGTGQSSADLLGVPGAVVAAKLTAHLMGEIVARGSHGGPLFPLASQLNDDLTHLQGQRIEEMLGRLTGEVRQALAQLDTTHAVAQAVVGDIPREPPAMQPRTDLVGALTESAGSGIAVVCSVTGARGVGKTQIAAAYARSRVAAGWPLVAWIDADGPGALLDDLERVAERLGLRHEDDHAASAARRLRSWLEGRSQPGLLVFDNATSADVLMPWIPATGRTQVVITGNHQALGRLGHLVQVDVYTRAEAVAYLNRASGRVDVAGATAVADELGCLPLAMAQAATVIAAQRLDYATYLERLRSLPVVAYLARSEGDPYPRGTAEAILLSLAEVEDRDPPGLCRPVIELLSILSPAGVPRRLLHQAGQARLFPRSGHRRQPSMPIGAVEVDAAVQRLDEGSLLSLSIDGLTTTVHRLVMRVVRERAEDKSSLTALAAAVADLLGRQLAMPSEQTWAQHAATGEIITQTTALWENTSGYLTAIESVHDDGSTIRKVLSLRLKAVWYLNEISDPARATLLGEDLVADCRRLLGDDHPFTVGTRSNLARAYELAGRLDEAIALHERVLADCQRLLGDDHNHTVGTRSNLARANELAGRLDEAIALHERVLADCQRLHGDDHPDTVGTRSNLARAYQSAGRLDEAIALHERTLADCQRLLGVDDPRTETAHRNLAAARSLLLPPGI
jgi:tetratricopeptide (TPR) repeat protein